MYSRLSKEDCFLMIMHKFASSHKSLAVTLSKESAESLMFTLISLISTWLENTKLGNCFLVVRWFCSFGHCYVEWATECQQKGNTSSIYKYKKFDELLNNRNYSHTKINLKFIILLSNMRIGIVNNLDFKQYFVFN